MWAMTDPRNLNKRVKKLEEKLNKASEKYAPKANENNTGNGSVIKILTELISGVAVGAILGYFLDKYFNTTPLLLVALMLLGMAGAMLNIYRDIMK